MEAMDLQTDLERQIIESALFPECVVNVENGSFDISLLLDDHQDALINSSILSKPMLKSESVKTDDDDIGLSMGLDWMDEKMDLSILDCPEGLSGLLDDPLAMTGDSATLLESLTDFNSSLIDIGIDVQPKKSQAAFQSELKLEPFADPLIEAGVPSHPASPVGIVPDSIFATGIESPQSNHSIILTEPGSPQVFLESLSSDTHLRSDDINMMVFITDKEANESISSPSSPVLGLSECSSVSTTLSDSCSSLEDIKFVATEVKPDQLKLYSLPFQSSPSHQKSAQSKSKAKPTSSSHTPVKEGRRERKRVQNKEAAARYRIKKRSEGQALHDEISTVESQNVKLKEKVHQLRSEIKYLKGLMREMFKARGLLK